MLNPQIFYENLNEFAFDNPDASLILPQLDCSDYELFQNSGGEWNLKVRDDDLSFLLYPKNNPSQEAIDWFSSLGVQEIEVLYVYGVGLGYYYQAALPWLRQNKRHRLIFLEDDLKVIKRFLELDQSSSLLLDPQVRLYYFRDLVSDMMLFYWLIWDHVFSEGIVSALKHYETEKKATYDLVMRNVAYELVSFRKCATEKLEYESTFYNNYYRNLFELPKAFLGTKLFGQFSKIPAIICGAGPSLQKNLSFLKSLEDKALIFGAGSSMNILNANHFYPHFGVCLDPFIEQYHRLLTNRAFEIPYFYRRRANHLAIETIHGPRLYVGNTETSDTNRWFEEKLGIYQEIGLDEGRSVVTLSMEIAQLLGCNPIILVGMDLSIKEGEFYASGIEKHPLFRSSIVPNDKTHVPIRTVDIHGVPVKTYWYWIAESTWISFFKESHPELQVINASEGGLEIPGLPNISLKEAAETWMNDSFDLRGLVHSFIQQSAMPETISFDAIKKLFEEFLQSLNVCQDLCQQLIRGKTEALEVQLHKEIAYQYLLQDFNEFYLKFLHNEVEEIKRLERRDFREEARSLDKKLYSKRFTYLFDVAQANARIISRTLDGARRSENDRLYPWTAHECALEVVQSNKISMISDAKGSVLSKAQFKNGLRQGEAFQYYGNGALYSSLFYDQNFFDGKQIYYYPDGKVKTEIEFKRGIVDGRTLLYFQNGQLEAELHFIDGKKEGLERRWYINGQLFCEAEYSKGENTGLFRYWYPDGSVGFEKAKGAL